MFQAMINKLILSSVFFGELFQLSFFLYNIYNSIDNNNLYRILE